MKQTDIKSTLGKEDVINLIGQQWMLVTAGTKDKFNTMTASWGGIGFLWNKPVAFVFIRPERFTHDFIESNERLTLSFYPERYRKALQVCGTKSGREIDKPNRRLRVNTVGVLQSISTIHWVALPGMRPLQTRP